jgi:hypothetical protein
MTLSGYPHIREQSNMISPVPHEVVPPRIVVDTNVMVAAMISAKGVNREVLRACFEGKA